MDGACCSLDCGLFLAEYLADQAQKDMAEARRQLSGLPKCTVPLDSAMITENERWEGACGKVIKVTDRDTSVAVKVPVPKLDHYQLFTSLAREARLLHELGCHPNIIPFMGVLEGRISFITPFYEKGSLAEMLYHHKALNRKTCAKNARILSGIASGLAFLHSKGVIHRDLAPENILLGPAYQAVICDFGCAKNVADEVNQQPMRPSIVGRHERFVIIEMNLYPVIVACMSSLP